MRASPAITDDDIILVAFSLLNLESTAKYGVRAGVGAALVAIPQLFAQQQAQAKPREGKSPIEKLRELKQMLDEGLITKEEYELAKKEILEEMT